MNTNVRNSYIHYQDPMIEQSVLYLDSLPSRQSFVLQAPTRRSITFDTLNMPVESHAMKRSIILAPPCNTKTIIHGQNPNMNFFKERESTRESRAMSIQCNSRNNNEFKNLQAKVCLLESQILQSEEGHLLAAYRDENDKLSSLLRMKLEEIEGLKESESSARSKLKELEVEKERALTLARRRTEEAENAKHEFRSLEDELEQKISELDLHQDTIDQLEIEISEWKNRLEKANREIIAHEEASYQKETSASAYKQELDRLTSLFKSKSAELSSCRTNLHELELKLSSAAMECEELKILREIHSSKLTEIESLKIKITKLEGFLSEMRLKETLCEEREEQLQISSHEISRLKQMLKLKAEEVERHNRETSSALRNLEETRSDLNDAYKVIELKSREVESYKAKASRLDSLSKESLAFEMKLSEVECNFKEADEDRDRLFRQIKALTKDLEGEKKIIMTLSSQLHDSEYNAQEKECEMEILKSKLSKLEALNKSESKATISEYCIQISSLEEELRTCNEILISKKEEYEKQATHLTSCKNEIIHLNQRLEEEHETNESKESELSILKGKFNKIESAKLSSELEFKNLKISNEELENKLNNLMSLNRSAQEEIERNNKQIHRLTEDIFQKSNQLAKALESIDNYSFEYNNISSKLMKAEAKIEVLEADLQKFKDANFELQKLADCHELHSKQLSDQIHSSKFQSVRLQDSLVSEQNSKSSILEIVDEKDGQINQLRSQLHSKENQIKAERAISHEVQKTQVQLQESFDEERRKLKRKIEECEELRRSILVLEERQKTDSQEIADLQFQLTNSIANASDYTKRLSKTNHELKATQEQFHATQLQLEEANIEITNLNSKVSSLSHCIEKLRLKSGNLDEEINGKETAIEDLENQLKESEIALAESKSHSSKLECEIKKLNLEAEETNSILKRTSEDFEIQILTLKRDIERLQTNSGQEKSKISSYEFELTEYKEQIDIQMRSQSDLTAKYNSLVKLLQSKESQLQDYEGKLALLTQEIERMNVMLKNKITLAAELQDELESVNRRFEESQRANEELVKLRNHLNSAEIEISNLNTKNESLHKSLNETETQLQSTIDELSSFKSKSSSSSQQLIDIHHELETRIKQFDKLNAQHKIVLAKIVMLSIETTSLRVQLNEERKESQSFGKELRSTKKNLIDLKSENININKRAQSASKAKSQQTSFGKENSEIGEFGGFNTPSRLSIRSEKLN